MFHSYSSASLTPEQRQHEHRAWLVLSRTAGFTLSALWKSLATWSSAQEVLRRLSLPQPSPNITPPQSCELDQLEEQAQKRGERILTPADPEYPQQLLALPQPPAALYVAGQRSINVNNQIALVGSRLATPYGMSQAAKLARQLGERGVVVTSGLARGIDAQAHRGALQGGGHTIAVVGNGLDQCYPRENRALQRRLQQEGNIVSEYPYGTPPHAWNFPARNRIIAGLALGVVIVQASRRSGALITAHIANDLGREVMVVPGALDVSQSAGCLQLLMEGANPVRHVRDVFDVMQIFEDTPLSDEPSTPPLSEKAQQLLGTLDAQGATLDALVNRSRLEAGLVASILSQLHMLGIVQRLPDGNWIPV